MSFFENDGVKETAYEDFVSVYQFIFQMYHMK